MRYLSPYHYFEMFILKSHVLSFLFLYFIYLSSVQVIYALNTKNDENEVVLQIFKDQHEEEKKSLLADMETKIKHYR